MSIKAVIFDLDGTLVNSLNGIAESTNRVLNRNNLPLRSLDEYKSFIGSGRKELIRKAATLDHDSEKLEVLFQEVDGEYYDLWDYKMAIYDGIPELLDFLVTKGISISVNSSRDEVSAKRILGSYINKWDIHHLICCDSLGSKKPDPEGVNLIIKSLGITNKEVLYVGDTEVDIMTAKSAGVKAIGVSWGYRSSFKLKEAGADSIIEHPEHLIEQI